MKKPSVKLPEALFLLIFLLLVLPFIQGKLNIFHLSTLKGAIEQPKKMSFTFKEWFSGEYQEKNEKYVNESFGFRSFFIRINNQFAFSLFHIAKANGVIIGKENYLFEENYIKAYNGTDFIGIDSITHRMQRVKFIQDTLAKLNKNIILVFAAGKGSFYPEFFPDDFKTKKGLTNYEIHVDLAKKMNLNYIDFNNFFVENKFKSKFPLYPQYGIHWSTYGMCIAADSMIRYIENIRGIDMPNLYWNDIKWHQPKGSDYDIADGMNILFKLRSFKMAYPTIQFQSDSGKTKPTVLVISDSYYWGIFGFGISTNAFSNSHFWFYNKQIYPDYYYTALETSQINLKEEIAKHDVIIILGTEATLPGFGWGFIENTYNLFKGINIYSGQNEQNNSGNVAKEETLMNAKIQRKVIEMRSYLKTDKKWMKQIEKKAALKNISVDSMIVLDAIWIIQNENKK